MKKGIVIGNLLVAFLAAGQHLGQMQDAASTGRALNVTLIANDGFLLELGGKKVLIDALFDEGYGRFMTPPKDLLARMTEAREQFSDIDLLLVTHDHGDHFNPKHVMAHLRNNPRSHLVAHSQVVARLRQEEGFEQIRKRIRELKLEPGVHEQVSVGGIDVDALCLAHMPRYQNGRDLNEGIRNVAFIVRLGGVRFFHLGDAMVENSLAHLNAYPFDETPVDLLFLDNGDRSSAAREFIGQKIKPSRIVAMHTPPAELAEGWKKVWAAYPFAVVFRQSMEQHSLPIEVDFHHLTDDYFGQPEPGATPQVFARGIVSSDLQEHGAPRFSPDGNEVFWSSNRPPGPDNEQWIAARMTMRRENGFWSAPYVSPWGKIPAFSADGRRAYFDAPRPGTAEPPPHPPDIWVAERRGDDWSEPKCLDFVARYPELRFAFGPTIARNGNLYFGAYTPGPLNDYGIYRSELIHGEYSKPQLLPRSINLPPFLNWSPFIAPDERYLLFSSNREGSLDEGGDLYISHRLADGSWTDPVSLGEPINTRRQERIPIVSNDGKYLFFSRFTPDHHEDVFWVSTATVPALRSAASPPQENPK